MSYIYLIILTIFLYIVLDFVIKKYVYIRDTGKRKATLLHLKSVAFALILNFSLELLGFHNKWMIDFVIGISAMAVLYNLGTWYIFRKYATVKDSNKHIKESDEIYKDLLVYIKNNDITGEFTYEKKRYEYKSEKIYELLVTHKSNKETRLYDMFYVLVLFFAALLYLAVILDGIIVKDSMAYGVILLFGAAFILPYLQDIKHTIRFARNPHLSFDSYVSFWINGKELFGKIIDMNTYEIILFRRFSKDYVTISHAEIKTFSTYESGKRFKKLYIVSKEIKYSLEENFSVWIEEFNEKNDDCLDLKSLEIFFTTEDDDHGLELNIFVKQDFLETYTLIVKKIEDFIQRKADENKWSLETPKRHDIKIISDENETKINKIKGGGIPN